MLTWVAKRPEIGYSPRWLIWELKNDIEFLSVLLPLLSDTHSVCGMWSPRTWWQQQFQTSLSTKKKQRQNNLSEVSLSEEQEKLSKSSGDLLLCDIGYIDVTKPIFKQTFPRRWYYHDCLRLKYLVRNGSWINSTVIYHLPTMCMH